MEKSRKRERERERKREKERERERERMIKKIHIKYSNVKDRKN